VPIRTSVRLFFSVCNNPFEIYLIIWWHHVHKTSTYSRDRLHLFHNPILLYVPWDKKNLGNFLFSTSTSHRQSIYRDLKEKSSTSTFLLVSIYKRMNLFALVSTDLFRNALDNSGTSNIFSLCSVSFLHQQPLTLHLLII